MPPDMSFACPDWQDKLRRFETPIPDLPYDEIECETAVALFNKLRIPDVPGQPTFGEAGGEWMRDIVRAAFGCIDPVTRSRLIGEIFNLVPKKNGKTTNAAALGILCLLMNRRPNVDGVIIGPTQEIAEKCFSQACAMIDCDPYLRLRFKIVEHRSMIIDNHVDPETGVRMNTKLKIKSFDPKVVTGSIPAFAILDELHLMAESHYAARVIGQIRGGMITNPDSLLIIITTQSETIPQGVFKDELDYARKVRDGEITEGVRMLPILYEFPVEMQAGDAKAWRNEANWPMVLPNLGRSIDIARLRDLYRQSADKSIEEEARWASQHLNIEIGLGLHADRWSGAVHWLGALQAGLTLETLLNSSDVVTIGGDWGGADDLAALCFVGRHAQSKVWQAVTKAWARPSVFAARKSIAARLRDFEKDGDLRVVETGDEQAAEAADLCLMVSERGLLPAENGIGLDQAAVDLLMNALEERGLLPPLVTAVGQGWKLQHAINGLPLRLEAKKLRHGGQPIFSWSVGNAKQRLKGSNYVVEKEHAGAGKIDPVMALFNAAMLMRLNPVAAGGPSVYQSRGILVI